MGSPTFGFPSANNNAPLPMFGHQTNPTGGPVGFNSTSFPNVPMFGPMANAPVFGTAGTSGVGGLNSGFDLGTNWRDLANRLGKAYGKGAGQGIYNILSEGLFNPKIADAFLNSMQPGVERGEANLLNAFGSEGSRFGSAAQLGLGDYLSQVNLNENQVMAQMFMQAQQEQLGLLNNVLPTLQAERANEGGMWQDILGGIETIGGLALAPFSGGLSLGLVGTGLNTLASGLGGGKGSTNPMLGMGNPFGSMYGGGFQLPGFGGNTGTFGNNAAIWDWMEQGVMNQQSASAASNILGDIPGFTGQ